MTTLDTLEILDELIQARSILRHPFYVAWSTGDLTRPQLATYATLYYPHVAAFPGHIETAMRSAADPLVRGELECNLTDERSNPKPHVELWLDFAEGMGLDRDEVASAEVHPAAGTLIETLGRFASAETAAALAAFYSYESQQPEVSVRKTEGLRRFYGVGDSRTLAYFDVHAEADVAHSRGEREALRRCLDSGALEEIILSAGEQTLQAYWGLLDGICEEAGIPLACHSST